MNQPTRFEAAAQYTDASGFIDVKKLIEAYPFEDHVRRADEYFRTIDDPWVHHFRKPYHEIHDTAATLSGFAAVLKLGKFKPGHVIVDFGCGAGWLSAALSMMRCKPIGLDISEGGLDMARRFVNEHPLLSTQDIRFEAIRKEKSVPLDDASVDRVICFDSFHHVSDQAAYLNEFHRVLAPGGLAIFHEPGPRHSRTDQSQLEMREFAVIENDIFIEDIWADAQKAGFVGIEMAVFNEIPLTVDLKGFNRGIKGLLAPWTYYKLGLQLMRQMNDKRVFVLRKAGPLDGSSRFADQLGGRLEVVERSFEPEKRILTATLNLANQGRGHWLPSGAGFGAVNLGLNASGPDGAKAYADAIHLPVASEETTAGESRRVTVKAEIPWQLGPVFNVEIQLVSEHVAWFGEPVQILISPEG
ncbi:class I SAM-dependent methyltransferase [Caulobacter sp. NIBR2454]|uniref:class I SAM-dependent methyltransferase n=1 Tax=Caulobacter sp. NIBR2454 TaxID=3015996 RepID=UPI0022B6A9C2|nr:class I SAM-dependent methyltransferase [Caulobacter sp. NIBR2454]